MLAQGVAEDCDGQQISEGEESHEADQGAWRAARGAKRWSQRVTRESNALDLKSGDFTLASPRAIALSLKRSGLASRRRKTNPCRSALSMLTFYVKRAGRGLCAARQRKLGRAKGELRPALGKR